MTSRGMRTDYALRQRYRAIFSYTGMIFMLGGLLMLTPLIALLAWPEEQIYSLGFIIPAAIIFGMGMMMWIPLRPREPIVLTVQEGGVIVLISWIMICVFSAFPLMIINKLGFTQAVFESVSGYTTTGLSVVDVTKASHLILLWRSIMQLAGGAGFAIIILASITEPAGPGFTIAEGRTDQLVPNVRRSSKLVLRIYSGYAIVGVAAYCLAGMTPFEAINHAFPAISTGGFSDKPESIGHWNSATIEAITIALMIMGNLNFLTAYLFLKGKLRTITRNGEVRLMAFLIPVCSLILFLFVCRNLYPTFDKSIRVAIFETVSALTTTGFSTVSYTNWNGLGILVLIVLMLIGGGTCSTAGGIKQYRIYLLFKSLLWEIRRPFFPRTTVFGNYVWQGEQKDYISDVRIRQVSNYLFLYLATFIIGSGILAAHGYGFRESLFEFASAIGTVGLSIGITSVSSPHLVLWTETFGMFLGRLEFFIVFLGFMKIIGDSHAMFRIMKSESQK